MSLTQIYAERGDTVFACWRDPRKANELIEFGKSRSVQVTPLDVSDDESVAALAKALSGGAIDLLINNAGIIGQPRDSQTATSMDFSMWATLHNVNTMGPVRVMQALLPHLKQGAASGTAKVMNVTSDLGALSHDDPIFLGYSASKAALNKFMRLAALELKRERIAIGLVHPGWVQTDMGGVDAPILPSISARGIASVIDRLDLDTAGGFWQWDGTPHAW